MTDTETLTDEQALQLEEQEREAEQASTEPATIEPESDGADTPDTAAEPEGGKEQKMVPLAALHEARAKAKELQQHVQQQDARLQSFEDKWAKIQERLEPEKSDAPKVPDFNDKPLDHLQMRLNEVAAIQQQQVQAQQMAAAQQQVVQQIGTYEVAFRQSNPDYYDAVGHAKRARINDHMLYGIPEEQARLMVDHEALQLAGVAMKQGKDPASAFYDYAKSRGYQKAAPAAPTGASVTDIAKVREQTKSLGAGGGRTAPTKYTFEQIANMDVNDPRFDEALESLRAVQK